MTLSSPHSDRSATLERGTCIVGAGSAASYVLAERTVSRQHLALELVPEGVRVVDLDSTNGTMLRGRRVTQLIVSSNATLRLGRAVLELNFAVDTSAALGVEAPSVPLIGDAPNMQRLFARLEALRGSLLSVFISGEPGVGKTTVARVVHEQSALRHQPMTAVSCAGLDASSAERALFDEAHGAVARAIDGTLFLDAIDELPLATQARLLRALHERELRPASDDQVPLGRTRLIAAASRDLDELVQRGDFRRDLYRRLNVVPLQVPALRERRSDIPRLALAFARDHGLDELPPHVVRLLEAHDWPGNVRELADTVAALASVTPRLGADELASAGPRVRTRCGQA